MKSLTVLIIALVALSMLISAPCQAADDGTRRVLRDAVVGAGTGAVASGASGGKAGTGALIGAGTGALGGILMDVITGPSGSDEDKAEQVVATQEVYQMGYEKGYKDGFQSGFDEGLKTAKE